MNSKDLIAIGRITGTYGYQGIVRIEYLTDFPERFAQLERVLISCKGGSREVEVEDARPHKGVYLLKLKGIDSREEAQEYINALLQIEPEQLYPLPSGYYYHFQLEGLSVVDEEKGPLGELTEILETGANDVYVVKSPQYGEILIPAIKEVILDIDLEAGIMLIRLLPGLV